MVSFFRLRDSVGCRTSRGVSNRVVCVLRGVQTAPLTKTRQRNSPYVKDIDRSSDEPRERMDVGWRERRSPFEEVLKRVRGEGQFRKEPGGVGSGPDPPKGVNISDYRTNGGGLLTPVELPSLTSNK